MASSRGRYTRRRRFASNITSPTKSGPSRQWSMRSPSGRSAGSRGAPVSLRAGGGSDGREHVQSRAALRPAWCSPTARTSRAGRGLPRRRKGRANCVEQQGRDQYEEADGPGVEAMSCVERKTRESGSPRIGHLTTGGHHPMTNSPARPLQRLSNALPESIAPNTANGGTTRATAIAPQTAIRHRRTLSARSSSAQCGRLAVLIGPIVSTGASARNRGGP